MEMKWSIILRRSAITLMVAALLLFEAVALQRYTVPGCRAEDLALQNLLPAQAPVSGGALTDSPKPTSDEKVVYLTFDDGPSATTEAVLDVLQTEGVPATFFVMADGNNEKHLPLLERSVVEGHLIALHTCTHTYKKIYQSPEAFWADIEALKANLAPYGCGNTPILRFPGGSTNTVSRKYGGSEIMKTLKAQATERGYRYVDWNVCGNDSVGGTPSAANIYRDVLDDVDNKNVCVVLLHDSPTNKNTAQALPDIIKWFKNAGYRFDTVDHLDRQI